MRRKERYLKTAIYLAMGPPTGRQYVDATWKHPTTGTYDGPAGAATEGVSCGAVGSPGSGGFILGGGTDVFKHALLRRGYDVSGGTSSCWQTGGTKATAGGATMDAVWPFGEGLIDLCGMHDLVVLLQMPPEEVIRDIKKRSRRPGGTKVLLGLFNFMSFGQVPPQNIFEEPLRALGKTRLIKSNTVGSILSNTHYLDVNEALGHADNDLEPPNDATQPGGEWVANPCRQSPSVSLTAPDASDRTFVQNSVNALLATSLEGRYPSGAGLIDGIIMDNVSTGPYYGAATNQPTPLGTGNPAHPAFAQWTSANYQQSWRMFLSILQDKERVTGAVKFNKMRKFGKVWGNTGGNSIDFATYEHDLLPGRFCEFFFQVVGQSNGNTFASMRESLRLARAKRTGLIAGLVLQNASLTTDLWSWVAGPGPALQRTGGGAKGSWGQLLAAVESAGMLDDFYVMLARTSTGCALAYHPTFGPVG